MSGGKITELRPATPHVNEQLVRGLERLLQRARSGELLAAVVCCEQTGGEVVSVISGDFDVFRMLGVLDYAAARVRARIAD